MRIIEQHENYTVIALTPDVAVLFSYKTAVAAHVAGVGFFRTDESLSMTTSKHVSKWLGKAHAAVISTDEFQDLVTATAAERD